MPPARCFTVCVLFFFLLSQHSCWIFCDFTVLELTQNSRRRSLHLHPHPHLPTRALRWALFSQCYLLTWGIQLLTSQSDVSVFGWGILYLQWIQMQRCRMTEVGHTPHIPALCFCGVQMWGFFFFSCVQMCSTEQVLCWEISVIAVSISCSMFMPSVKP